MSLPAFAPGSQLVHRFQTRSKVHFKPFPSVFLGETLKVLDSKRKPYSLDPPLRHFIAYFTGLGQT